MVGGHRWGNRSAKLACAFYGKYYAVSVCRVFWSLLGCIEEEPAGARRAAERRGGARRCGRPMLCPTQAFSLRALRRRRLCACRGERIGRRGKPLLRRLA